MTIDEARAIMDEQAPELDLFSLVLAGTTTPEYDAWETRHKQASEYLGLHIINQAGNLVTRTTCSRCGGSGYLHQYDHIDNGRCWSCNGTGYTESISY